MGWRGLGGSAVITARLLFLPELLSMSKLPFASHNCLQAAGKEVLLVFHSLVEKIGYH